MKKIAIFGATSVIAQEAAKLFADGHAQLFLIGRNPDKLEAVKNDLLTRGAAKVDCLQANLAELSRHTEIFGAALRSLGQIDGVLIAHGDNGNQLESQRNPQEAIKTITVNSLSVISLATLAAQYFDQQQNGCLAVISSVAGDRGRKSNYVYGSAKAGVSVFMEGLLHRFSGSPVRVLLIKLGLVKTPMLPLALHRHSLAAHPRDVGQAICRAMQRRRGVSYMPGYWRFIMAAIKALPNTVFNRLNL